MAKFLKPKDVAALLEVDGSTVRGWIAKGLLPALLTPGGQYRIDPRDVDALMTLPRPVERESEAVA